MQERVFKTPNITVLFEHNTLGLFGENGVEAVSYTHLDVYKRQDTFDPKSIVDGDWGER